MPKNISAATLMVLSACIIWGAQPMFVTFVVREFDPIPLVSIRYFTVGVVLLAAVFRRCKPALAAALRLL